MESQNCALNPGASRVSPSIFTLIDAYAAERISWLRLLSESRKEFDCYLDSPAFEDSVITVSALVNRMNSPLKTGSFAHSELVRLLKRERQAIFTALGQVVALIDTLSQNLHNKSPQIVSCNACATSHLTLIPTATDSNSSLSSVPQRKKAARLLATNLLQDLRALYVNLTVILQDECADSDAVFACFEEWLGNVCNEKPTVALPNPYEEENARLHTRIAELERRLYQYESDGGQFVKKRRGHEKEAPENSLYRNELDRDDGKRRKLELKGEKRRREADEFRRQLKLTFLFMFVVTFIVGIFLTKILPLVDDWNRPPPSLNAELQKLNLLDANYHLKTKT